VKLRTLANLGSVKELGVGAIIWGSNLRMEAVSVVTSFSSRERRAGGNRMGESQHEELKDRPMFHIGPRPHWPAPVATRRYPIEPRISGRWTLQLMQRYNTSNAQSCSLSLNHAITVASCLRDGSRAYTLSRPRPRHWTETNSHNLLRNLLRAVGFRFR
jgi:hypothetical protein